jgi:hypothetical protein
VKEYLTSEKVDFKQIRVDDDPKTYDELKKKTNLTNEFSIHKNLRNSLKVGFFLQLIISLGIVIHANLNERGKNERT